MKVAKQQSTPTKRMLHTCKLLAVLLLFAFSAAVVLEDGVEEPTTASRSASAPEHLAHLPAQKMALRNAMSATRVVERDADVEFDELLEEDLKVLRAGGTTMGASVEDALGKKLGEVSIPSPKERMLVHNGKMSISTPKEKGQSTASQIEDILTNAGGYVENKSSRKDTYSIRPHKSGTRLILEMTMRIPSSEFHSFISKIEDTVGPDRVSNLSFRSEDVTDSFVDATSRAATLKASLEAMQMLLSKADKIKDAMEVQRELNRITQDYESQKSMAANLQKQSSLSTLRLELAEEQEKTAVDDEPTHNETIFSGRIKMFYRAIGDIIVCFTLLVDIILYGSVVAVGLAIPCTLLYALYYVCTAGKRPLLPVSLGMNR